MRLSKRKCLEEFVNEGNNSPKAYNTYCKMMNALHEAITEDMLWAVKEFIETKYMDQPVFEWVHNMLSIMTNHLSGAYGERKILPHEGSIKAQFKILTSEQKEELEKRLNFIEEAYPVYRTEQIRRKNPYITIGCAVRLRAGARVAVCNDEAMAKRIAALLNKDFNEDN